MTSTPDPQRTSPVDRVIDAGLILILLVAPTQQSIAVLPKVYLSLVDPLVWLVAALWAMRRLAARDFRAMVPPLFPTLLIAAGALSVINAAKLVASLKDLFQFTEYFIVAFLLFRYRARDAAGRWWLASTALVAASIVIAVVAVQYFSASTPDLLVRGTFGNRNVLGGYLAMTAPLAYGLFLHENCVWRSLWLAAIVLAALLLTLSGGSLIAIALACGAVAMLRHPVAFLAWAACAIVVVTLALPHMPRDNYNVLFDSISIYKPDGVSVSDRYTEWQAAAVMVEQNPALGVGIGNYQQNIGIYYGALPNPVARVEDDSQSMYFVVASTMGLTGLACLLGMLFRYGAAAARAFGTAVEARDRGLLLGVFGALVAFSINCVWSPLIVRGIGIPLALLFALAAAGASRPGK
jgi:O-antigen ligase